CSLIGAGGLGEFIFSGISLVNSYMTLAGAIPAALLALLLDGLLALVQKNIQLIIRPVLIIFGALALFLLSYTLVDVIAADARIVVGFDREFSERADGYPALKKAYGLNFESIKSLDSGLMYEALKAKEVDVISGYSTEGKIESYQLRVLEDDAHCFPPYFVAPCVNQATLRKYPELRDIFARISGQIPDSTMRRLNLAVDQDKRSPVNVARDFLRGRGLQTDQVRRGKADIIIGGKNFTEQYILLEMFKLLIENYSSLTVEVKRGMGGTQILFDALKLGDIDMYPEYTGTAFLVLLSPPEDLVNAIIKDRKAVYRYVQEQVGEQFNLQLMGSLEVNNAYAIMMQEEVAAELGIRTITDLATYLQGQ
ncbi:MAG: glycine betaine ABC transporter substrate-binding protein, partial [Bacteroidota bacterium]